MKIRKLDILGFKSFVDHTVLHFNHDVTGIVGPNGCGKSNVVDAIKWAMGEQSAQRLRGRAMEDVIFNGCETRGPHGFAEVSITFDNTDGLAPPEYQEYAEVTVTRRLDRQGNSDYFINKTPVRLMDITNLFLGTGVGRRAYSIIEQGRIGFIVSSKPEDRRSMIEEAAGVTKFKARKRAAERKMDQTRQNLLRVSDIITEIERNLASLKRQAQKAERYKAYRAEVRDLELLVASHRWLELTANERVVRSALDQAEARVGGTRMALRVREAEVEGERALLSQAESQVEQAQNRAYELDNAVRMLEGRINQQLERLKGLEESERLAERELGELVGQRRALGQERDGLRAALEELERVEADEEQALEQETGELERRRASATEAEEVVAAVQARVTEAGARIARAETVLAGFERRRTEARARLDKLRTERESVTLRIEELGQERAELESRLAGLRSGRQRTAEQKAEVERELEQLRVEIRESDHRVEELREELSLRRSRLRSLEELSQRFEGVGAGVRALMTELSPDAAERAKAGLLGLVADRVECPAELTAALAAALGDRLSSVVIDRLESGVSALSFLREGERGRAALVPRSPRRVVGCAPAVPVGEGIVGRLADRVQSGPEDEALMRHLLGDVLVVDSLETALALHRAGRFEGRIVTLEGDRLDADGTLTGGAGDDVGTHMLEVQREVRELHGIVARLDAELTTAVERHGNLRRAIAERQASLDAARTEAHDAELAIVATEKDVRRSEDERDRAHTRGEALDAEVEELSGALEVAGDEEAEARSEIDAAHGAKTEAEQALDAAGEVARQRREAVDAQSARVTEVRVRAAQAKQRAESDRSALERLMRSIEELDTREERLRGDVRQGAEQQGQLLGEVLLSREELAQTVHTAMGAHEVLGGARAHYDEARRDMGDAEVQLKELRDQLEGLTAEHSELTLRERELGLAMEHLLEQVEERHRLDLRRVIGDYHLRDIPDAAVRARIDELLRLIERMGEINLMAIEEYEEKSQRHEYLTSQRADLEDALTQLDRAIRQMNRESRRLFREAFVAVNERFKVIFPRMFGGGRARARAHQPRGHARDAASRSSPSRPARSSAPSS